MTARGWRIRSPNGTYFAMWTSIGPRFGASREEALVFPTAEECFRSMGHWAFTDCEVEGPQRAARKEGRR